MGAPKRDTVIAALQVVAIEPVNPHNRRRGWPGACLEGKQIDQLDGAPTGSGRREASAGGIEEPALPRLNFRPRAWDMGETDRTFAGSIPDIYDAYLAPLLFEPYASDLARRVAEGDPAHVLETAAGTGVVTRALAPVLGSHAHYLATDLNQPMLDRAANQQGSGCRIAWRQADALNLPFKDDSFDAVVCQFGAMFFPDRVAGYREARRVLKRGGRFLFNVWDRIEENEFACAVTAAVGAIFPADPPRFLARLPHGYHDLERIELELRTAGFSGVECVTLQKRSEAPSPRHAAIGYCQGTPLRAEIEARDPAGLEAATASATDAIAQAFGQGAISGKIQAHVIAAQA
jgi:ubiquinone/menaquinone biosynthesis C-methylase UbiE